MNMIKAHRQFKKVYLMIKYFIFLLLKLTLVLSGIFI